MMKDDVARAWREASRGEAPPFAETWRAAERRHAAGRRAYRRFATAATVAAVVIVVASLRSPGTDSETLVELADLLDSTSWSAPSDVLLPEREFDIYQDMPMLIESTNPAGGSLL